MIAPPAFTPSPGASDPGELRPLLRLALPLVGANLLQMAVYSVDAIFVARLGTRDFAAATLGVYLFSLVMWALIGLTTACAALIAAERGRRTHAVREVRRSFRMALWLAVLGALPFILLLLQGERVLIAAGQDPEVAQRAGRFLRIVWLALIPGIATAVMRAVAAALDRPGWALGITAMGVALGILFNWLLVFGHGGFPALGIEGSATASILTSLAMCFAYALVLARDPKLRRYRLFGRWWRPEWRRLGEIVRLGAPIMLTTALEAGLFGGAAVLMGLIGVADVAAHAVALNIAALAFQLPLGVAQAATVRVGLAFGAGDAARVGRAGRTAIGVGTGIMAVTATLLWIFPRAAIAIYLDPHAPGEAAVIALAVRFLAVAAMFQLFDGAQVVTAGVLRGLQDTRVPMLIAAFGYWVAGFGTAILLGFRLGWGGVGIWTGLAVGLAVVAALLVWRWHRRGPLGLLTGRDTALPKTVRAAA